MVSLKPLVDRVVVRQSAAQTESKGGLVLVPSNNTFPDQGMVIAVGPKVESVVEGDEVLFRAGAGVTVHVNGEKLLALKEEELYAVVAP